MKSLLLSLLVLPIFWTTHAQDDCTGVCGRRPLASSHASSRRIIGTNKVLPGTWPWQISLIKPDIGHNLRLCSGVLISSSWVVTAAHCLNTERFIHRVMVMAGSTDTKHPGNNAQMRYIRNVIMHEKYNNFGFKNDIALVELDMPVNCNDYIQPACLPDENVDISSLTHCWITGWGFTNIKMLHIMQEAKVNLIPNEICNRSDWHRGSVRSDHLCAGYEEGGIGSCLDDSGGPLNCREPRSEHFWVIGIFSVTNNCNLAKRPGLYTSTQFFLDWIKAKTNINFYNPIRPVTFRPKPTTQSTLKPVNFYTPRPYQTFKPISETEYWNLYDDIQKVFEKIRPGQGGSG